MPASLSIEAQYLLKLLADGEWHDLELTKVRLAGKIAPGKALRRYMKRVADRELREGPRKSELIPESEQIASGQRILAGVAVNSMKKKYVECRDSPDGRQIRVRPNAPHRLLNEPSTDDTKEDIQADGGVDALLPAPVMEEPRPAATCPECGLYVVNRGQHDEWHVLQAAKVPEPASQAGLVDEAALRKIVREEVNEIIDDFQRGMAGWLVDRFADLEDMLRPPPPRPVYRPVLPPKYRDRRRR
jgi:hypothetical protein